ncbi:ABC transporter ATP-binding protein [Blattabacterium cuenoti]|uniref:ABC transporter ATP-binding protein n=1 Tax=Blattabacterium cuenoti TaxID=1653831 RepID=UPI00163CEC38|nr:ABC transporter ATP-binding protein [Blattabacterium cuenoti]
MVDLLIFSKKYIRKYTLRLCVGFSLILLSNFLTLFPIPYIGKSIDAIKKIFINTSISKIDYHLIKREIYVYTSVILIVPIIGGYVKYHMRQCIITTSRMIEFDLKNEIFTHYQKLNLSFYKKNSTGDLMNRLTEDVSFIRQYIGPCIMYFVNLIVLFFMVFIQMFFIDKTLTYYVIIPIPVLFISVYLISIYIAKRSEEVQNCQSSICSFMQETFSGIHVIKSFVSESFFQKRHIKILSKYRRKNIELVKVDTILSSVIIFLIGTSHLLILFFGGKKYFRGEIKEIGVIAEFLTYINTLIFPFIILGWIVSIVERAKVSKERICEFLDKKPKISYNYSNKLIQRKFFRKIQFKNVSFIYNSLKEKKKKISIKQVSFTIHKGKTLILTGETGSGKTTIGRLISRLYDPNKGEILIDNLSIKNYDLYSFRSKIGYVPQESFLFSDSIYNNIAIGCLKKVKPYQVYNAAKNAMIEDDILNLKKGYHTIIGERGMTLSVGQRQRICIARAIIRNPSILIFDDSFSAIDQKTRKLILRYIKEEMKNSIIIIITHDTSYISDFDLVIFLKNGKICKIIDHRYFFSEIN